MIYEYAPICKNCGRPMDWKSRGDDDDDDDGFYVCRDCNSGHHDPFFDDVYGNLKTSSKKPED